MKPSKSNLMRDMLSVVFTRFFAKGLGILTIGLLIIILSPAELGTYGMYISILFLVVTFSNLGLKHSLVIDAANDNNLEEHYCTIHKLFPLLAIVCASTSILLIYFINKNADIYFYLLTCASSIMLLYVVLHQGVLLGKRKLRKFNLLEVLPKVLFLILLSSIYLLSFDINDSFVLLLYLVGLLITCLIIYPKRSFKSGTSVNIFSNVKKGAPFCIGLSLVLLNSRIPIFSSSFYGDSSDVGIIFAAIRINDIFLEAATAFSLILFGATANKSDKVATTEMIKTSGVVMGATTVLSVIGYFALDLTFIRTLSPAYSASLDSLQLLLVGAPFFAFCKIGYGFIAGKDSPVTCIKIYIPVLIIHLVVNTILLNLGVELFAEKAYVLAQIVGSVFFFLFIYKFTKKTQRHDQ